MVTRHGTEGVKCTISYSLLHLANCSSVSPCYPQLTLPLSVHHAAHNNMLLSSPSLHSTFSSSVISFTSSITSQTSSSASQNPNLRTHCIHHFVSAAVISIRNPRNTRALVAPLAL
ncbi:hypothetical protein E2C01_045848 [Portunus trituberculatus]|uniref:Uncharacterized protein n=1 Tax=Portunus trituberculatus TaxID=210409 RepID=A0A5B7FW65_PORTR|nr:hypothetical protein [Portunus trituberculatus]